MPDRSISFRDRLIAATREGELEHLQALLAELQSTPEADPATVMFLEAEIARHTRDIQSSLELLREVEPAFASAGDQQLLAECLRKQAACLLNLQESAAAEPLLMRALDIHQSLNDRHGMGLDRLGLGSIFHAQSDMTAAYPHLQQAADLFEEVGDRRSLAGALGNIAILYSVTGQFERPQEYFHRALDETAALGAKDQELSLRYNLATMHFEIGDVAKAQVEYTRIIDIARDAGNVFREQQSALALVNCDLSDRSGSEDPVSAEQRLSDFLSSDLDPHYASNTSPQQILLAECIARQGRHEEALAILDKHQERASSIVPSYARAFFIRGTIAKLNGDLQAARTIALQDQERAIAAERQERERERAVLHSTLPAHIADRVIRGEDVSGDHVDEAAVMSMDIVGFTTLSSSMSPKDVTILLDEVFSICDTEVARHGVTRIKTIGDSYMAVAFPDIESPSPARRAVQAAVAIRQRLADAKPDLTVRIGIHVGPVVAGVIGKDHLQYDVWGDTVNMASCMESTGEPGRIQVNESFAQGLRARGDGQGEDTKQHTIAPIPSPFEVKPRSKAKGWSPRIGSNERERRWIIMA